MDQKKQIKKYIHTQPFYGHYTCVNQRPQLRTKGFCCNTKAVCTAGCLFCHPSKSVKALKGKRHGSKKQQKTSRGLRQNIPPHNTHPFNSPFSGTTWVNRYQKGKTNLDFTEARDSEWQWHSWTICKPAPCSRQTTTPAPHHSVFFTGRIPFNAFSALTLLVGRQEGIWPVKN